MDLKEVVLKNLCYTDLVYQRINKKLGISLKRPSCIVVQFIVQ